MTEREKLILYAVTDRKKDESFDALLEKTEKAILGGVTCVQLREKHCGTDALVEMAKKMKRLCSRYGVPLIVNDDFRAAIKAGADGVHVGMEDAGAREIRKAAGDGFIIGVTAKTTEQARKAEEDGADYLGVGAVFPSPTKRDAVRITPERLREITQSVKIPAVAIGGINLSNVASLSGTGICGVCAVSAIFDSDDTEGAARKLREAAEKMLTASPESAKT